MDWNGAEVRAQSAVRWPSNADAGGKQTPVGWLLDRVFQTATSSIAAGALGLSAKYECSLLLLVGTTHGWQDLKSPLSSLDTALVFKSF